MEDAILIRAENPRSFTPLILSSRTPRGVTDADACACMHKFAEQEGEGREREREREREKEREGGREESGPCILSVGSVSNGPIAFRSHRALSRVGHYRHSLYWNRSITSRPNLFASNLPLSRSRQVIRIHVKTRACTGRAHRSGDTP